MNQRQKVTFSVIICCYNSENYLEESINSIAEQTIDDWELIIINDGSNDSTSKIINNISDSRIKVVTQLNVGPTLAAYKGIENSRGNFVIFLDADDTFMPGAILGLLEPFQDTAYSFSYCDYLETNIETHVSKYISLTNFWNILACGVMFKRRVINEIDFWDQDFILPEYDYIKRVLDNFRGMHVPKALYHYYRHSKSFTADKELMQKARDQIFKKYGRIEGFKKF